MLQGVRSWGRHTDRLHTESPLSGYIIPNSPPGSSPPTSSSPSLVSNAYVAGQCGFCSCPVSLVLSSLSFLFNFPLLKSIGWPWFQRALCLSLLRDGIILRYLIAYISPSLQSTINKNSLKSLPIFVPRIPPFPYFLQTQSMSLIVLFFYFPFYSYPQYTIY